MKWILVIGILVPEQNWALKDRRESRGWTSYQACAQAADKLLREYKNFDPLFSAGCQADGGMSDIILPQGK